MWRARSLIPRLAIRLVPTIVRHAHGIARPSVQRVAPTLQLVGRWGSGERFASSGTPTVGADGIIAFNLADIGEGIAEAEIIKWFVKEGESIKQFDKVCEVQSDKANVEITSRYDGVIDKLAYAKGEMAKVGKPLMFIKLAGGAPATDSTTPSAASITAQIIPAKTPEPVANTPSVSAPACSTPVTDHIRAIATPAVRRIARENNLNLAQVNGTGKAGRVMKEDVLRYMQGGQVSEFSVATSTASSSSPATSTAGPTIITQKAAEDRVEPLRGYRRAMVKTMTHSLSIPHFGYSDEVLLDRAVSLRAHLKEIATKQGVSFTLMPILIKAASMAMHQFPILNASLTPDGASVHYKASHNIGVAVDTPNGLIVPNIKNVQNLSLFQIAKELNRLQAAAAISKISVEDLTGGTFTLSNVGVIGGTYTSPVIVSPEVCIGAIGRMRREPRYDSKDNLVPVRYFNVSWSADHRVIDGATMAHFSNAWKSFIEHPDNMLLHLK